MNAVLLKCLIARIGAVEPALGAMIQEIVARALVPRHVAVTKADLPPLVDRAVNCLGHRARGYVVDMPNVHEIPKNAFYAEKGLMKVLLPDNVMMIGAYAFAGTSIRTITIPNNVCRFGEHMLAGCALLVSVSLPGSMRDGRLTEFRLHGSPRMTAATALGLPIDQVVVRYRKQYTRRCLGIHDESAEIYSEPYRRRFTKLLRASRLRGTHD